MPFMDLIKKAIFEEQPQTAQSQPARPAPSPTTAARPLDPAPAYVPMGTRDNQFYTRLAKQTDLSAVPELAKIEAFAAPLSSVITDKALRYKAALATAQSQGGLTKDAILKGFVALLNVLNSSATKFNKQTDEVSRTEVDAKIAQIGDINEAIQQKQKEIAGLQQQVKSMQSQTEVSRSKLQEAKNNFAIGRRHGNQSGFPCNAGLEEFLAAAGRNRRESRAGPRRHRGGVWIRADSSVLDRGGDRYFASRPFDRGDLGVSFHRHGQTRTNAREAHVPKHHAVSNGTVHRVGSDWHPEELYRGDEKESRGHGRAARKPEWLDPHAAKSDRHEPKRCRAQHGAGQPGRQEDGRGRFDFAGSAAVHVRQGHQPAARREPHKHQQVAHRFARQAEDSLRPAHSLARHGGVPGHRQGEPRQRRRDAAEGSEKSLLRVPGGQENFPRRSGGQPDLRPDSGIPGGRRRPDAGGDGRFQSSRQQADDQHGPGDRGHQRRSRETIIGISAKAIAGRCVRGTGRRAGPEFGNAGEQERRLQRFDQVTKSREDRAPCLTIKSPHHQPGTG